jgi:alanine-synthesizing transaminase
VTIPPFSKRLPGELTPNRLAQAISALRAEGRDFVDLTISNPTRAAFDYPSTILEPLADPHGLVYEPSAFGTQAARAAVAREYARQGLDVSAGRIVLTASSSDAYSLLFKLLADAGDEVLVPRPSYPLFDHLTGLEQLVPRPYDLEYDGCWSIDFSSLERALGSRTRAVLIVAPNNPTGSLVTAAELDQLAAICARRGIAIICDEVFADYDLQPGALERAARVLRRDDVLSFALGGLSKSAGLPQLKLGWIATAGPLPHVNAALERLELICDTYLSVATPVQIALPRLLERGAEIRAQIRTRVAANDAWLRREASTSACTVLHAAAGWYAVVQVPRIAAEEDLVLTLLREHAVLTHPGYFYDFAHEAYLVVSLLTPTAAFRDGVGRVLQFFDSPVSRSTPLCLARGLDEDDER